MDANRQMTGYTSSISGVVFSAADFATLFPNDGTINYILANIASVSESDAKAFIEYSYETDDAGVRFQLNSTVSYMLDNVSDRIELLAQVFLYVGLGFAVFAALLLLNFITVSITYKKKEIGILRAIGARGTDVFGIFFNESMIITIINVVLAAVCTFVACYFINQAIHNQGIQLTVLVPGIRQVGLIIGVGVLVAFVATFFPVWFLSRKKPIDTIKK
jgi:ABC-type antimicrobial peptide transport system permease subunit